MPWLKRLLGALRAARLERDIRRETEFHIAERADELRASGLSAREATLSARARFGNQTLQVERTLDVDVVRWLDTLLGNLRYAFRTLARTPGFTATVVSTLALGIGANTVVFSTLDAVLLRPLPFPEPDRLVVLGQTQERTSESFIAPVRLEEWNRLNVTFSGIAGYFVEDVSEMSGDLPERVRRAFVTPRFLEVWGVAPAMGRDFAASEHRFGGPAAVLVSHRYWRDRLGSDPNVLGRTARLAGRAGASGEGAGGTAVPIVGVMPADFRFPDRDVDLWSPAPVDAPYAQSRRSTWYRGIGRMRPGVTAAQARENLAAVQARLGERHPETDRTVGVSLVPLKQRMVGDSAGSLWLLYGAVSVLLLIACTNVAALLLARAAHRHHEISIRFSLGASRAAVSTLLLTETAVLAVAGGALGALAAPAAAGLVRAAWTDMPRIDEVAVDGRVLLYTLACTACVAVLSGLVPALRSSGGAALRAGAARTQVSAGTRVQWLLVGVQVALSVTLLTGAGLLVRSSRELARVDRGFDAASVLTFRVSGSWGETADLGRLVQRVDGLIDALDAVPGVEAAATTGWALPGVPEQWETTFEVVEDGADAGAPPVVAEGRAVSAEYFATMRIPLLAGEPCRRSSPAAGQGRPAAPEVMVNRSFAETYLSARPSPVGLHIRDVTSQASPSRVAGVVGDARERGLHREPGPVVYWCLSAPNPTPYFLVRTQGDPTAVASAVRLKTKELEPLRSVYDVAPLEERIDGAFAENRLRAVLLTLFAAAALSLACVGLYGTLSYVVSLRRREVGLRMALGAVRGSIAGHFAAQGLRIVGLACACGLILSAASSRLLAGMLFGVSPSDPVTLAGVVGTVVAVAALAVLVPAVRAASTEPMQVLREP